jgi:hypothetical protein
MCVDARMCLRVCCKVVFADQGYGDGVMILLYNSGSQYFFKSWLYWYVCVTVLLPEVYWNLEVFWKYIGIFHVGSWLIVST